MRSIRVALFLAFRSITRGNYSLLAMSILIMALIFINLLFIPSLLEGAIHQVNGQFLNVYTSNIVVLPNNKTGNISQSDSLLSKIRSSKDVTAATGVTNAGNVISYKDESGSWPIIAVDPESYTKVFSDKLSEGSFMNKDDDKGIVLGVQIAGNGFKNEDRYSATLKTVPIDSEVTTVLGQGKQVPLKVKGIINNQFLIADLRAFISYKTYEKVFPDAAKNASTIYVKTSPNANIDQITKDIKALDSSIKVLKPESMPGSIKEQVDTIDSINKILSAIAIFVAAITVFIVTYVDLVNRRRVIGIERAIGIAPQSIVISYCFRAFLYAVLGIIVGTIVYRVALIPYFLRHPFIFPNGPVSLVDQPNFIIRYIWILLVVSVVAAWIPSLRSVRIKILDAIWGK